MPLTPLTPKSEGPPTSCWCTCIPLANITQDDLVILELVQTSEDWDAACNTIKETHGGRYPDDWFAKVLQSGLSHRVFARFGQRPVMSVTSVGDDGKLETVILEHKIGR